MSAVRVAWFKVHKPLAFYAAYFRRQRQNGLYREDIMRGGIGSVAEYIQRIRQDPDTSWEEKDLLRVLEVCYEFYLRGFSFTALDV